MAATVHSSQDPAAACIESRLAFLRRMGVTPGGQRYRGLDIEWVYTGTPVLNLVFAARFAPAEADARIEAMLARFQGWQASVCWMLDPRSTPPDLPRRLEDRGLVFDGELKGMALGLDDLPPGPPLLPGLTIETVASPAQLSQWAEVACRGFEIDGPAQEPARRVIIASFAGPGSPFHLSLARLAGEPVATLALFVARGVAGIYWVATVPQARRQGVARALMVAALRRGRAAGCRLSVLQATSEGLGLYRQLGYRECYSETSYMWYPSSGPQP